MSSRRRRCCCGGARRWRSASTARLGFGITAKDVALAIVGALGAGGGTGYVIEYTGDVIRDLSIEGRMTVCNMAIEAGARAGLVAPDAKTFAYLQGPPASARRRGMGRGGRLLVDAADRRGRDL